MPRMSAIDILPEEDDILAAELAFGLLDGDARGTAEARVDTDEAFAQAYRRWQDYAAHLLSAEDITPRPEIWAMIAKRIPANDSALAGISRATLRWWQGSTMVASVAAAMLAVIVIDRGSAPLPVSPPTIAKAPAPLVAVLTGEKGVIAVSYNPSSGEITSAASGIEIGSHAAELWVIPADGKPRSLGVIATSANGTIRGRAPAAAAISPGVTLAISMEPTGGSPTGLPTGPVILSGKIGAS